MSSKFQIIDCDTYFGFRTSSPKEAGVDSLISTEKAQSAAYAMTYSLKARCFDSRAGNDETLRVCREHEELLPVACVDPRAYNHIEDEIERVANLGFVAVRVFPEMQGWSVGSILFKRIVDACARSSILLMVSVKAAGMATQIIDNAGHTNSPILLLSPNYAFLAETLSAVASRPNTFLATQQFITPGAVEIAAEAIGAGNLIYSGCCPDFALRCSINMILGSKLSDVDKAGILGGNISRIIAPQLAKLKRLLSGISDIKAYDSKKFHQPIIDVHGHNGPWPFPMWDADYDVLNDLMSRRGVSKTIISSTQSIVNDFVEGNAELAGMLEKCDNLLGYVTINPSYPQQSLEDVDRYLAMPQFVGIKFHPAYAGVSIDSEASFALFEKIAPRKTPLLVHTWGHGEPSKVRRLARQFPEMPIIMGHGGVSAWKEAIDVLKNSPNVYTEFCSSVAEPGKIRGTIDAVGKDRVLFGTDSGLFDPAFCLGLYEEADLDQEERKAILWDNAVKLFGLK